MKDHEVATIVNLLRDETKRYADTQQLRARIAGIVVPLLRDVDPSLFRILKAIRAAAQVIIADNSVTQTTRVECSTLLGAIDQWVNLEIDPEQVLTEPDIEGIVNQMPGGIDGFRKSWGWLQFARRVEEAVMRGTPKHQRRMYCRECATSRQGTTECWKCGTDLFCPSAEWEEPALPPVDPIRAYAREIGYCIAEHGSKERDLDLVAVPWTAEAAEYKPHQVADYLAERINARVIGRGEIKPHGRVAFTLQIDGWFKPIDLSVMPAEQEANHDEHF